MSVTLEMVVFVGILTGGLALWVIHLLTSIQHTIRSALATFEDRLLDMEDESRRMKMDVHALKIGLHDKVDSAQLNKRLAGLAQLLGASKRR